MAELSSEASLSEPMLTDDYKEESKTDREKEMSEILWMVRIAKKK